MKLPSILAVVAGTLAGWTLYRLTGRVQRLEDVTGAWRVQAPPVAWADPTWYASDDFDKALARWDREMRDEAA